MTAFYFRRAAPGAAHSRYFVCTAARDGTHIVTHTQVSRPDGTEIREPARVVFVQPAPRIHKPERKRLIDTANHRQNARAAARELAADALPAKKRCPCCKKELSASAFAINAAHGRRALQSWCKACTVAAAAAKRAIARAMRGSAA